MCLTTPDYSDTAARAGLWRRMRRAGGRMGSLWTVSIAALIGLTPVATSAAVIRQNFTIDIGGSDNTEYASTDLAQFNPSLGTLTQISDSITGSTTWTSSSNQPSLFIQSFITPASQDFDATGPINIDLTDSTTDPIILSDSTGTEVVVDGIDVFDFFGSGTLSSATLSGTLTYTYTPAAAQPTTAPEPSSIALLGVGLCGLGLAGRLAAAKRTRAGRSSPGV